MSANCGEARLYRCMSFGARCSMEIDTGLSPRFVDTWLSRPGVFPLSIAFTIEPRKTRKTFPFLPGQSHEHFHVIFPLSHRWSKLKMSFLSDAPLSLLGNLGADALPWFRDSQIGPQGFYINQGSPLNYIFESSSRLQLFPSSGIQNTNISALPL